MRQRLKKSGNSFSIRIPRVLAAELRLHEDSEVELSVHGSLLIMQPFIAPAYSLDRLLSQVTAENLHQQEDWGPAVGKEAW